ncbi:MAG: ABC transporter permease [Patescibacteria group bacterium]
MNVVTRGIRNAFRNKIRTFSIVIILGLSIGLAISMLVARTAVETKIQSVKSSIGNTITISPAGVQGFQGGGEDLTTTQLSKVSSVAHVTKVTESLSDRLTTDNTNLVSAIDAGSFGNRQAGNSGVNISVMGPPPSDGGASSSSTSGSGTTTVRTFTPPVGITGTTDTTSASTYGGDKANFTSGKAVDATKDVNEATIGKALAEKNNLKVGSTFTAYGQTIKVVGIYDTGTVFSNAGIVMSLPSLQRISSQSGSVTSATATIDSIDNVSTALANIKKSMGSAADVVNDQDTAKQAVAPLESVKTISVYSLIAALIAGSVIILLTMVMIVRERRREIGVMKAIGASNVTIVLQFVCEAVTLTVLGLIVGTIIGITVGGPITNALVSNSSNSTSSGSISIQGGPSGAGPRVARSGGGGLGLRNVRDVQASVGSAVILEGVGAAILIAIVGSAFPALLISKVRPAEVMRAD